MSESLLLVAGILLIVASIILIAPTIYWWSEYRDRKRDLIKFIKEEEEVPHKQQ